VSGARSPNAVEQTLYHWRKVALNWYRIHVRKVFVIQAAFGGLGDTLFLSPLPRIAKRTGCRRVLISNRSGARDPAYRRLIWESNPYVDGFTDARGFDALPPPALPAGANVLDAFMFQAGLDDGERGHEPEVYWQPPIREDLRDEIVYDPNFITNAGALTPDMIGAFFEREGVAPTRQLAVRGTAIPYPRRVPELTTKDVFDFCSVIVSCKRLYCLTTGTATLAAALGKPCTVLWGEGVSTIYHHSKLHRYVRL
jgi:hypothetical protein